MVFRNILKKDVGDQNESDVKQHRDTIEAINALEPEMKKLSDVELRAKTDEFKQRLGHGDEDGDEELDDLLPEAFAVVREASIRTIGLRHFDEQLIGGIVLHQGKIAEMKTSEGKTLMATLPLYLNALLGKGAHLVTPNDYLSKFGAISMGPLYHFHGMSVGIIQGASPETGDVGGTYIYDPDYRDSDPRYDFARPLAKRGEAYQCDVTYGTNNEYGFDYLRDNLLNNIDD